MEFDGGLERIEIPEIPVDAVREAVINAFAHRLIESRQAVDVAVYKSYIDVYSPGTFPENVEPVTMMPGETAVCHIGMSRMAEGWRSI